MIITCACRLVKVTTAWTNNKEVLAGDAAQCEQLRAGLAELAAEALQGRCQAAADEAAAAEAGLERATAAVRCSTGADKLHTWIKSEPCSFCKDATADRRAACSRASNISCCDHSLSMIASLLGVQGQCALQSCRSSCSQQEQSASQRLSRVVCHR